MNGIGISKKSRDFVTLSLRIVAILVIMLMAIPMAPAEVLTGKMTQSGGHVGQQATDIEPPAGPRAGIRNPDAVIVGPTNVNYATSISPARHVVRGSNNTIYVVYENNSQIYMSKSTDNGVTFSTPISVSNDARAQTECTTPAIASNGTGIFVVYSYQDTSGAQNQAEHIAFRRTSDGGLTWTPPLNQAPTILPHAGTWQQRRTYPAIAVNNTAVYVVANNWNNDYIYFYMSLDSGTTWGPASWGGFTELALVNGGGDETISVSNESVYIAFSYWPTTSYDIGYIFSTKGRTIGYTLADFSAVTDIYVANTNSRYPNIASSGKNVYVGWQEGVAGGDEIEFRNTTNQGTTWTPVLAQAPKQISNSTGNARYPSITFGSTTSQFCTWRDSTFHGSYDLVYAERYTGVWGEPFYLTNDTNGTYWPSAAEKIGNNRLDIVWTNGTNPYNVLYDGIYVAGSAPYLNWTGEANYLTDGVNPDIGTTGHTYVFRVKYTDADNEAPKAGNPRVWIDKNLDGDYLDVGEQMAMGQVNPADTTYSDGKLYTYSTRLRNIGLYSYLFKGQDINGRPAYGVPTTRTPGPNITSINEPPSLFWLSDTNYENDGLDPETGFTDTDFTYKVMYLDLLNESVAAGFPNVYIDMNNNGKFDDGVDQQVAMTAVNPSDNTFDNGKIYSYTTKLALGTYKYMFYAEDLVGLPATTENRTGPVVGPKGHIPVLAPTGETGYTTDGVDPNYGTDSSQFTFRVKYSDADGDKPAIGYPLLGLDLNGDNAYGPAEKFVMDEFDPLDVTVNDGKIYTYDYVFGKLGTFKYQFEAVDTNATTALIINYTGPNVNVTNKPPVLEWLGAGGFATDGLDPEEGTTNSTRFFYTVIYKDQDGNPPMVGYPKVWIDQNMDGIEQMGEWTAMNDANASNTDCVGGKRYEYNTTLGAVGTYKYKFEALDSLGSPAPGTSLPTVVQNGPIVTALVNLAPKLTLLGTGSYNGTGVSPAVGDLKTEFVYKVNYIDLEGDMPGTDWPRVYIDADGDGTYNGPTDKLGIMAQEDPTDLDVTDGKVYSFKTNLPFEGDKYAYKFKAVDVLGDQADGVGSIFDKVYTGPKVLVNKAPTLQFLGTGNFLGDGVDPDTAVENSTFTYRVIFKDLDGDKPKDGKVYLRIDLDKNKAIGTTDPKIVMTEANAQDQNYADGKEYTATYKFTEDGNYGYRFETLDSNNITAVGPASVDYIPGPVVTEPISNKAPTLTYTGETNYATDGVNPLTALKGTKFTFRVKYIDVDNDAAAAGNPILTVGGQTYPMTAVDASDTNYADGRIYTVDVTLTVDQTYTYSFAVKNIINQTASLGPLEGPVVTKKVSTAKAGMLPDFLWIVLLIIIAIVVAIIGYLVGARKKKEPEQEDRHGHGTRHASSSRQDGLREAPMVPLTSDDVDEVKVQKETDEEVPEGPGPSKKEAAGTKADLKASAEQPTSSSEDAKKPAEDKPGPPVEAETKPVLKEHQSDSEAPADAKDIKKDPEAPKPEEKKPENVDDEIDSILNKLDK